VVLVAVAAVVVAEVEALEVAEAEAEAVGAVVWAFFDQVC